MTILGDLAIDVMACLQVLFVRQLDLAANPGRVALRSGYPSTALILFITSEAERFLPGCSAEISDAFIVW